MLAISRFLLDRHNNLKNALMGVLMGLVLFNKQESNHRSVESVIIYMTSEFWPYEAKRNI